jgi:hypothetical protein
MRLTRISLWIATAASAFTIFNVCAKNFEAPPPVIVLGIEARLFHNKTGTFSDNVLGTAAQGLQNVFAGEKSSVSTLIVVKLSLAEPKRAVNDAKVRLIARKQRFRQTGSTLLLDQVAELGAPNKEGVSYVGFWLQGTDCGSVNLKVIVTADKRSMSTTDSIAFQCGE